MSEVALHLGLAKTATTWLQRYVYPAMDATYYHCGQYDVIDKPINGTTIFSFEGLSGTPHEDNRYLLTDRLHRLFPNAKIILGIRDKEAYKKSLYSEYIKGGGFWTYKEFHDWLDDDFMDWETYIEYLKALWSQEDVYVYTLDEIRDTPYRFMDSLADFIGTQYTNGYPQVVKINTRLSSWQIRLYRSINSYFFSKWNDAGLFPRWMNPLYWLRGYRRYKNAIHNI